MKFTMTYILLIISGLLTAFSFPTVFGPLRFPNLGFLAWFSLVPLLYVIRNASPRRSFVYTFITFAICYSVSLYWLYTAMNTFGHLTPTASVGVLILLIILLSTHIALAPMFSAWVEKKTGIARFWTLPIFWVVVDFAMNYIPCNGFPWGNITNSQFAYLPVIQIVDIVGIYGLTYVMVVFNSAIAEFCSGKVHFAKYSKASFAATLIISMLIYGFFRIGYVEKMEDNWRSIRVALLQGNIPQDEKWRPGMEEEQLIPYKKSMQELEGKDVNLVVWPEASYPLLIPDVEESLPPESLGLSMADRDSKRFILLGALTISKPTKSFYNSMILIDNNSNIIGRYHKVHLVPFGEYVPYKKILFFAKKLTAPVGNLKAGEKLAPLYTDDYQIGGLVCYEDLFPEISREMTRNGANLLAAVTNDAWYGVSSAPFQHLAISVFRAVENRRWLVKSANTGVSAVVSATGRIISKTNIFEEGMIVSSVKLGNGSSLYTLLGDWFAWGCVLIGLFLFGWGLANKCQMTKPK